MQFLVSEYIAFKVKHLKSKHERLTAKLVYVSISTLLHGFPKLSIPFNPALNNSRAILIIFYLRIYCLLKFNILEKGIVRYYLCF